ncbi:MAG: orotate phosphoribosyltransferase [Clostridiales bacterium]|nr:orotate phosphoribosyltransferase [Clostridiales bacterium]
MERKQFKISARTDNRIELRIIPGHFATPQSHITHYLDITMMKSRCSEAQRVARDLSHIYVASTPVDTIICMDGMEVVGAFLAQELTKAGVVSMNAHQTMYITTPEYNSMGQILFRDNTEMMVRNKNILILNGSITTGKTLYTAIESILYYGGRIRAITAIFSAVNKVADVPVYSIFQQKDVPSYQTYSSSRCPLCQAGQKIDALVNGYGYSKL